MRPVSVPVSRRGQPANAFLKSSTTFSGNYTGTGMFCKQNREPSPSARAMLWRRWFAMTTRNKELARKRLTFALRDRLCARRAHGWQPGVISACFIKDEDAIATMMRPCSAPVPKGDASFAPARH